MRIGINWSSSNENAVIMAKVQGIYIRSICLVFFDWGKTVYKKECFMRYVLNGSGS